MADSGAAPPPGHEKERLDEDEEKLPLVLLLGPRSGPYIPAIAKRFRLVSPWESQVPIGEFLATQSPSKGRALLVCKLTPVTAEILASLPDLECVVTTSAGVNHIDLAECARRGIAVANIGDVFSENVADLAIGLLIDVLRRVSAADRYVRCGLWPLQGEFPLGSKLGGKRAGIVGLGSIGSLVAKRLEAFGCTISYNSRTKKSFVSYKYYPNVCDLAAESDVLVISCALTSETHHIINKDIMSALGKDGIIINVGRGALVDEKELVMHLMRGEIRGAGLDVFEHEPDVPEDLLNMDNVVLSPHHATDTPESTSDLLDVVIANLDAFFAGKPLLTPVFV